MLKNKKTNFILSGLAWIFIASLIEDPFKNLIKEIYNNLLFIEYLLPIMVFFSPLGILFIIYNTTNKRNIRDDSKKKTIGELEKKEISVNTLPIGIRELGIIEVINGLRNSDYTPDECIKKTRKKLLFLGILGSKWVERPDFIKFLDSLEITHGKVKFLLVNPSGQAYKDLHKYREGTISYKSLELFYNLQIEYKCLKVKLYNQLPSFRMSFLDDKTLVLSNYKIDKRGYFESEFGWANPHIIIDAKKKWSLYNSFESLYYNIWEQSIELKEGLDNLR